MIKDIVISAVVIFIVWTGIDYFVHGHLLQDSYLATADLWRPMEEAKMGLNSFTVFVSAAIFSIVYIVLVDRKSVTNAILYGFLLGLSAGVSWAYGSYAFMPIPYEMALTWFATPLVEGIVGGVLLALIAK